MAQSVRKTIIQQGRSQGGGAEGAPAPPLGVSGGPRMQSGPPWSEGPRGLKPVKRLLGEERASERVSPARAEGGEGTFNWLVHGTLLAGH